MIKLIGLSGYKQSGKDTVADIIIPLLHHGSPEAEMAFPELWTKVQFAGELKRFVERVTGLTRGALESETVKSSQLPDNWMSFDGKEHHTYRWMLQHVGTEVCRLIHPNFWVNALFAQLSKNRYCIITDCRFPNEAQAIKDREGIIVRIINNTQDVPSTSPEYQQWKAKQHASEVALDDWRPDWYIYNNGVSMYHLGENVKEMLNHFNIT